MKRKRISGADRRSSILEAARSVFAERGYEGAKTQQIAAAAKVSEALVYRHFPSKMALYRAVLRQLIREQNENFASLGLPGPSTQSLVLSFKHYFRSCLEHRPSHQAEATRIMLASLAGDGSYARLIYRRAVRLMERQVQQALDAARAAGDLKGAPVNPVNVSLFLEHIGSMMAASRLNSNPSIPYGGDDETLLRNAVWFCGRGLGLTDEALEAYYDSEPANAAPSADAQSRKARA